MNDASPSKRAVAGSLRALRRKGMVDVGGTTQTTRIVFRMDGSARRDISRHEVNQYRLVGDPPPMY